MLNTISVRLKTYKRLSFRSARIAVCGPAVLTLFAVIAARADSLVLVTSQAAQKANDSIRWSQLGPDGTIVGSSFNVKSAGGTTVGVALKSPNSVTQVVCPAGVCDWTGAGFTAGDTLLWTSDAGNGSNGPVTLTFGKGVLGAGALIQADGPGQFTAEIQAFNGSTSLGSVTLVSQTNGNAAYIGVSDLSGANITSLVFSLTSCVGTCTDFALDTVSLNLAAPAVTLSPTSLTFSTQLLGTTSAAQTVTLKNSGTATLTITSIVASGDFAETNTCGSSLAVNASCPIKVTFHPTAIGTRTGAVTITDNAAGSPQSVKLTGTGTEVKLSATSLTFPATTVNTVSAPQSVTLTNVGSTTLTITSISLGGTDPSDYSETNTCGNSVKALGSCTLTMKFQPKAKGIRTASVLINDNGGASPQQISLTGTGQ